MMLRREEVIRILTEPGGTLESVSEAIMSLVKFDDAVRTEVNPEQETRFRALKEASGVLTPIQGFVDAVSPSQDRRRAHALIATVDWVLHGPTSE